MNKFLEAGLAILIAAYFVWSWLVLRAVEKHAGRIIRRLPSTHTYQDRRVLDDPRLRNLTYPRYRAPAASALKEMLFSGDEEEKTPAAEPAGKEKEAAVGYCCFAELGTKGLHWTIADDFFCRGCGSGCFRLIFAGEAPGKRIPFGCLSCDNTSCNGGHKCTCLRDCGMSACTSENDPERGGDPGYEPPLGSRFAP